MKYRYRLFKLPNMTKNPYFPIFSIVFYSKTMENLRIQSFWWRHAFQTLKICTVDPHSHRNLWEKGHWFPPNWTLNSFSRPSRKVVHLTVLYYSVDIGNDSEDILSLFLNCGVIKRPDLALILPNFGYKHEKIYTMKEFPIV